MGHLHSGRLRAALTAPSAAIAIASAIATPGELPGQHGMERLWVVVQLDLHRAKPHVCHGLHPAV
jgi:hypothetical protein